MNKLLVFTAALSMAAISFGQNTWVIKAGDNTFDAADTQLWRDVAAAKQLVNEGKAGKAKEAFSLLLEKYPQLGGEDYQAYVEAELLIARGKLIKAGMALDKFLDKYPQSSLYNAALGRTVDLGKTFMGGYKKPFLWVFRLSTVDEGVKLLDKVADIAGDSAMGQQAAMSIAYGYEDRKMFIDAYFQWSAVAGMWPTGEIGKEALLGMARNQHASYRGPNYDSTYLRGAKSYFEEYLQKYPGDADQLNIPGRIGLINEQLALKEFKIAEYHRKKGDNKIAMFYYKQVAKDWPNTRSGKAAIDKLSQNIEDNS